MNELSKKIKWRRYTSLREGKPHKTSQHKNTLKKGCRMDGNMAQYVEYFNSMHQAQGLAQGLILSMW